MSSPLVGVIMGSDSDLKVMGDAARVLEEFGVPFEMTIVSAHRTPQRMVEYATQAATRGLSVIIAGAGGAAHLPGMVAALTPLPVVGVPIAATLLNGNDALLSIVQMPAGVPVATVAINNATNAALLAVQILGTRDPRLREAIVGYKLGLQRKVLDAAGRTERHFDPEAAPPQS
jgi:phosphoribosylaminoimidazole carboxylase PurE protein